MGRGKLVIVAGLHARRVLKAPPGRNTRPTTARTREALFSILTARLGSLEGCCVLDAFAGSGVLGLEAYSRGAQPVVFVENDRTTAHTLRENIAVCRGAQAVTHVLQRAMPRALKALPKSLPPIDLVFLDPPYGHPVLEETLKHLSACDALSGEALIVVEREARASFSPPDGLEVVDERCYASSALTFLELTRGA